MIEVRFTDLGIVFGVFHAFADDMGHAAGSASLEFDWY